MFNTYYQQELAFLRDTGRLLAERSPGLMAHLAMPGTDPDVERLLEGFALLAANIRERVESSAPDVADPLAELVAPHAVRPTPACTIVELSPRPGALKERMRVEAGALLGSRPVDGVTCTFSTSWSIDVLPMALAGVVLDAQHADAPEIVVSVRASSGAAGAVFAAGSVPFYLHGSHALASTLLVWFARHLDAVTVRCGDRDVHLGARSIRVPSLQVDRPLWRWPSLSASGTRTIVESFALPQKHFFVELNGLDQLPTEARTGAFEVRFRFRRPPALPERLAPDAMRLHCVPAANLFAAEADPIARDPLRRDTIVRAAGLPPNACEVFDVTRVVGLRSNGGGRIDYGPITQFGGARGATYALRRARSPVDGHVDTFLAVRDVGRPWLDGETLSSELFATNRGLTAALRPGDVCVPLRTSPSLVTFKNVSAVSAPLPAQLGQDLQWKLLGAVALAQRELACREGLTALLGLHNIPETRDLAVARANATRAAAIREVHSRPTTRVVRGGGAVRGVAVEVVVDEGAFTGAGDAFGFGCLIDRVLAAGLPLNTFSEVSLRMSPSNRVFTWDARTGTGAVL